MKKSLRHIALFTLLILVCNFFMPIVMMVNAVSTQFTNYFADFDSKIVNINNDILEKKGSQNYIDSVAYKVAVDTIYKNVSDINTNHATLVYNNNTINLTRLILNSNNTLLINNYNSLGLTEDLIINNYDYDAIDPNIISTLGEDNIINLIINNIFHDNDVLISDYINVDDKINELVGIYNNYINTFNSIIGDVDNLKNDVDNYYNNEISLGNVPNMTINDSNVYDLLENIKSDIKNYILSIEVLDTLTINNNISDFNSRLTEVENSFYNNNSNLSNNNLLNRIDSLKNDYENVDNLVKNSISIDQDLIDNYIKLIGFDDAYNILMNDINNYLERKPSDSDAVNNYLVDLNNYYNIYSSEKVYDIIRNIISNDNSYEMIKLLEKLTALDNLDDDIRKSIYDVMINNIQIGLLDESNYYIGSNEKNIILYNVLNNINDLDNNLFVKNLNDQYINFSIDYSNNTITVDNGYVFKILINGDINNNDILDEEDLSLLIDKINNNDLDNTYLLDINNDKKVDTLDVVKLASILNLITLGDEIENASYRIVKTYDENYVYYEVYLDTLGVVNGIKFNLNFSNIDYVSYETDKNIYLVNENNTLKLLGYGEFSNNTLLVKLTFKRLPNNDNIEVNLNGSVYTVNNIDDLLAFDLIEKEVKNDNKNNDDNKIIKTNNIIDDTDNIDTDDTLKKDDIVVSDISKEEVKKDEIIWGSIIKVIIIVLLGTLIIYFLNKNEDEEFLKEELLKKDKEKEKNNE